jgi:hypothetical protein
MNLNLIDYIFWGFLGLVFLGGLGVAGFTFDKPRGAPKTYGDNLKEAVWWQKVIFFIWIVAGPIYLVCDYYHNGSTITKPLELSHFTHKQKLFTDLWTAVAVLFGLFWGLKKS